MSVREGFVLAPIIVLIFVMGLVPRAVPRLAKSSVDRLVGRFQAAEARLNVPHHGRHDGGLHRRCRARRSPSPARGARRAGRPRRARSSPGGRRPHPVRRGSLTCAASSSPDFIALLPVAILDRRGAGPAPLGGLLDHRPARIPVVAHGRVRASWPAPRPPSTPARRHRVRRPGGGRRLLGLRHRGRLRRARPLGAGRRWLAPGTQRRARRVLRARALQRGGHGAPRAWRRTCWSPSSPSRS